MKPLSAVFLLLILGACSRNYKAEPTYSASLYSVISPEEFEQVNMPEGEMLNSEWELFEPENETGLNVPVPDFKQTKRIDLPHRVPKPNSPFWYRKNVNVQPGMLVLNADDGAQVWVNGERRPNEEAEIFPITESGEIELTIRVLNNAMSGGLRWAKWISASEWDSYQQKLEERKSNWLASTKAKVMKNSEVENHPVLFTEPVWLHKEDGTFVVRWVSESGGSSKFVWGELSEKLDYQTAVESGDGNFVLEFSEAPEQMFYQIIQGESVSPEYKITLKSVGKEQRFAIWGDSQGGWPVFKKLIALMNEHQPAYSVGAGDLVGYGSETSGYFNLLQSLSGADFYHYPIVGNHDYVGYYEDYIPKNYHEFSNTPNRETYFSWREGGAAFIAIDPNAFFPVGIPEGSEQYNWLMEQFKADFWTSADWRFVVLHQPPFSQGWPGYHGEQSILELLEPYYKSGEIDVMINGHSHNYERLIKDYNGKEVAFVVSGGAGGGLEPIENSEWPAMDLVVNAHHFGLFTLNEKELVFAAYNLENELIDTFTLTKE